MSNNTKRSKRLNITDDNTPFAIKEAFSQLRTNIVYSGTDNNACPVYAITSAGEQVGKSTVTANIAISFTQINKKVLLIDADMRRPTQYMTFGYDKNHYGLSELLAGIVNDDAEVICSPVNGLSVLLGGCIPPNPSDLLHSNKMDKLMKKWKTEFDVIFIDLPPVNFVSDALNVAHLTDGYIIVTMDGKSNAKTVNSAIADIEAVGAKITGVVLNGSSIKKNGGNYYPKSYNYKKS